MSKIPQETDLELLKVLRNVQEIYMTKVIITTVGIQPKLVIVRTKGNGGIR